MVCRTWRSINLLTTENTHLPRVQVPGEPTENLINLSYYLEKLSAKPAYFCRESREFARIF